MDYAGEVIKEALNGKKSSPEDWKRELLRFLLLRRSLYVIGSLLLLVGLRIGVNRLSRRKTQAPAISIETVRPSFKNLDNVLNLPGNVEAIERAGLYAHISGYLKKIYVDEGDPVREGQLLADIDAPDVIQEYHKAKADADLREQTLKRYQELLKGQVVSQQEFDTIEAEAREAKARLENAAANMEYTKIKAPFSGSIARRFAYPGDLISEATRGGGNQSPIFLLVNEKRLRVSISVPQTEVNNIGIGHPVDINVDGLPGEVFHGLISRVDALLDEATKTQRVLIDIDNPKGKLRAGMFASVVLHTQHKDNALTIPKDALQGSAQQPFVYIVANGQVKQVSVKTSLADVNSVEIARGLGPSDQVVVGNQSFPNGAKVRAVEADQPALDK